MQQAALSRRERQIGEVKAVLWFVCVNQRDLRETSGVSFEQYRLSKFGCVFSRRLRRSRREECSGAALYRRERQFDEVNVVLLFICVNQRDLRETSGVSFVLID